MPKTCNMYSVSGESINSAFNLREYPFYDCLPKEIVDDVLEEIGIVACELCRGRGIIPNGSDISPCSQQCTSCHGNKWVYNAQS